MSSEYFTKDMCKVEAFRPLRPEQANEFGMFRQSRGMSDIEAP